MKLKEGFIFRKIAGDNVVVPVGQNIKSFNGLIRLNDSAAFLWNLLKEDITKEELVNNLKNEYEIDESLAISDVDKFIGILKERNMLEGI